MNVFPTSSVNASLTRSYLITPGLHASIRSITMRPSLNAGSPKLENRPDFPAPASYRQVLNTLKPFYSQTFSALCLEIQRYTELKLITLTKCTINVSWYLISTTMYSSNNCNNSITFYRHDQREHFLATISSINVLNKQRCWLPVSHVSNTWHGLQCNDYQQLLHVRKLVSWQLQLEKDDIISKVSHMYTHIASIVNNFTKRQ